MSDTSSKDNNTSASDEPTDTSERNIGFFERLRTLFTNGSDTSLRESLEDVIEQHERSEEDFSAEEQSMLLNILRFGERVVEDVMVPRADITAIDMSSTMGELMATFKQASHSRLPVYRETLDDVIGMVHIKDMMAWLTGVALKPPKRQVKNPTANPPVSKLRLEGVNLLKSLSQVRLHREVLFVPPSMPAADLLVQMQTTRIHMAIVVDEYGGTDGLVSIEDLIEEIVGEIEDEHDIDGGPLIIEDGAGRYIADARILLDDLRSFPGLRPLTKRDEDIDTLGGLVFSIVGRIPVRGELIVHESGLEFEILEADPRRLKRLRIFVKTNTPKKQTHPDDLKHAKHQNIDSS